MFLVDLQVDQLYFMGARADDSDSYTHFVPSVASSHVRGITSAIELPASFSVADIPLLGTWPFPDFDLSCTLTYLESGHMKHISLGITRVFGLLPTPIRYLSSRSGLRNPFTSRQDWAASVGVRKGKWQFALVHEKTENSQWSSPRSTQTLHRLAPLR